MSGGGRISLGARRRSGATLQRGAATSRVHGRRPRARLPRPGPRALGALAGVVLVLVVGYLWVRDSSLVSVQAVKVTGVSGPNAGQIRSELRAAARRMTTLDVDTAKLHAIVAPYPVVKRVQVSTSFPHGMTIHVVEEVPVAFLVAGGRRTPVASDGMLLRTAAVADTLPTITLGQLPGGNHVSGYGLSEIRLLAAAPYALLPRVATVTDGPAHGLSASLRSGPSIYFGSGRQLATKWTAAVAVLADAGSRGAAYIDVTDPSRPAAGAGSDAGTTGTTGTTPGSTTPAASASPG